MQTPVQIDFQGMKPSEELRSTIDRHVTGLEDRFGRVTACRVALKAPGEHHHTGGLYAVSIHLALPDGKEVNIGRTPRVDDCRIRSGGCRVTSRRRDEPAYVVCKPDGARRCRR